ncbi:glycosyltransferase involved in cell wall biosynthesis [Neobacillus niacini]|uniref:glycosyltransferase family 4 protein n=1 Tax=Neobacillus niacini TaxID=86668 RepID=UPI002862596C|nr:glycosyltransferase family 4 protein [Neobacillus niacini]MDR7078845.1 glycosyltransferase involved in cell wall biosynthesis [Neobacillus niacini]
MLKIGYVVNADVHDKTQWSGTIYNLYNILSKNYEVEPILLETKGLDKYYYIKQRVKQKLTKKSSTTMMVSYSKLKSKKLNNILQQSGEKYDVLFFPANSVAAAFVNTNIPIVYLSDATFHVMIDYYLFNLDESSIENGNMVEKRALENANQIIYASDWAKNDAITYYGINENKINVLPFGANLIDKYNKKSFEPNKEMNLLFVGVEWERKGADVALECLDYLNQHSKSKYKLTIIGLENPGTINTDNVNFVGFLNKNNQEDYNKMIKYYQESDIFILPTRAECAGIVFSEASMYGLPIVTYDTGGIQSYVEEGVNGFRLQLDKRGKDFAEKIEYICNEDTYLTFSKNSRNKYENSLNWDKWLETCDEVIKKCLMIKRGNQ